MFHHQNSINHNHFILNISETTRSCTSKIRTRDRKTSKSMTRFFLDPNFSRVLPHSLRPQIHKWLFSMLLFQELFQFRFHLFMFCRRNSKKLLTRSCCCFCCCWILLDISWMKSALFSCKRELKFLVHFFKKKKSKKHKAKQTYD